MADETYTVPSPPFTLRLSDWDLRLAPVHSKRILCFPLPHDADRGKIISHLHAALRATVLHSAPFLAGSIVPGARPWLRDVRAEGGAVLRVRDLTGEIGFEGLRARNFSQHLLDTDRLCFFPKPAYVQREPYGACAFQANFVDGGLLLTVEISHTVCDGRGISEVLRIFAERFRDAQAGGLENGEVTAAQEGLGTFVVFDRAALLSVEGVKGDLSLHPGITLDQGDTSDKALAALQKTTSKTYKISSEALAALKKAASSPAGDPSSTEGRGDSSNGTVARRISTHDAISALVWRTIMLARRDARVISHDTATTLAVPVDYRSRLNLPAPYFGNAIYPAQSTLAVSTLAGPDGLRAAASAVRAAISAVTADSVRDLLAAVRRTLLAAAPKLTVITRLATDGMMITSYFAFAMHELDFGPALGRIAAFRLPAAGIVPGVAIVLPRLGDGGCEVMVNEQEEVMRRIEGDEVFGAFASAEW